MTDKEFKKLNRSQLVDIIYQLQVQIDRLNDEKQKLAEELADKRLRISSVGNIAEAALEINDCFRSAQNAADQYLNEIKTMRDEAEKECQMIIAKAKTEASEIVLKATETQSDYNAAVEKILKEIKDNQTECDR